MAVELPIVTRLNQEMAELRHELHHVLPKIIEEAREHGDLKENAEYHAAKERQGMLNARIGTIEERLRELSVYTLSSIPKDRVGYGSRVDVEDVESGLEASFEFVFHEEADPDAGKVSISSPVGQAFLTRRVGDEVTVVTPSGKLTYEVLELTTIHAVLTDD